MKFRNTTDIQDQFLRRMLAWVMRELEVPRAEVRKIHFGNRSWTYSGVAYTRSRRLAIGIGQDRHFPCRDDRDHPGLIVADRIEGLIVITAHEVFHIRQHIKGQLKLHARREQGANLAELRCLESFRRQRETLMAAWEGRKAETPADPVRPSLKERNFEAAQDRLKAWERRLKLAQTKVKKYRAKVRRYEKQGLAARPKSK